MDDAPATTTTTEQPADDAVPVDVSAPPGVFVFAFGFPVFCVVLWFMVRLFSGRWITDPEVPLIPPPPGGEGHGLDDDPPSR